MWAPWWHGPGYAHVFSVDQLHGSAKDLLMKIVLEGMAQPHVDALATTPGAARGGRSARVFFVINRYRRRETLGLDEQLDLKLEVAEGVVHMPKGAGVRALYRVPTLNLDTASAATRRGARAQ